MKNKIHFLDNPNLIHLLYFLSLKDIFYLTQVSKNNYSITIQETIKQTIFDIIQKVFLYYERYYHIPFYTSRRTSLHMLKIEFIYQNFYIFTNKLYKKNIPIQDITVIFYYKIKYNNLKKIFKYYSTLVAEYYSKELLCRALRYNNLILLDLVN